MAPERTSGKKYSRVILGFILESGCLQCRDYDVRVDDGRTADKKTETE
jgi:hypothetical protein